MIDSDTAAEQDDYQQIVSKFLDVEKEYDFYDVTIDGVPIWELLRYPVSQQIRHRCGCHSRPGPSDRQPFAKYAYGIRDFLRYSYRRNPLFANSAEILFYGFQRRKKMEDGLWWDIFCDPIVQNTQNKTSVIEDPYLMEHRTPTPTDSLYFTDFIQYASKLQRLIGVQNKRFTKKEKEKIRSLTEAIENEFGVTIDFETMIRNNLEDKAATQWLYQKLLDRVSPELVVVVVSYGKETFIESCKSRGIPVIELQHGEFNADHFGFSFPGERSKQTFPDYLFTFGEYWKKNMEFAIDDEHVIPVGYPYLEAEVEKYADVEERDQLIVISQRSIGEKLSKLAVEINLQSDFPYDIVYKLHPMEYNQWESRYPWLLEADIEVVSDNEKPLYKYLAESKAQLGVYSTALYEGLNFELDTYIYTAPGYSRMRELFCYEYVSTVTSVEDFLSSFDTTATEIETEYFFKSNAIENTKQAIERIMNEN